MPALNEHMPREPEDHAAFMLILSSVPSEWHYTLASKESAYEAVCWIIDQFTGGHNLEATERWRADMKKGMQPGETLVQYVRRMINLKNCLHANGFTMLDREVTNLIIKCLP